MLDDVRIRDARPDEANFAAEMTRKMLVELEQYGGRAAAKSDTAWDKVAELIGADLGHDTTKHVVAEPPPITGLAMPQRESLIWKDRSSPRPPCTLACST